MLTLSGFEAIVSNDDLSVFDHGRYNEIVQMLSDLGYLTISDEEGKIIDDDSFRKGVFAFRREAVSSSLIGKSSLQLPFPEIPKENHEGILSYHEFSVLQLLVSLDGDFTLKPISEIKNIGIYTRVIQYRLHLMGLLKQHPNGVYSGDIDVALDQLANWLAPVDPIELLNLLGNICKLISHFKACKSFKNKIVYFHSQLDASSRFFQILGPNINFLNQLERDVKRKSTEYKDLISRAVQVDFDADFFEARCRDSFSDFIIRLSQIAQWISGYYLGKIDGELGNYTFESFRQLGQAEKEHGNTDFEMGEFIGYISNDYWVVNPHYLFREITVAENDADVDVADVFNKFNNSYKGFKDAEKKIVEANLKNAWLNINVNQNFRMKSIADRFSRIYFGARSLIRSFWKDMKSIVHKLKNAILDLSSGLFNMIKNFAKYLYREIREALQIFSRGISFLFGNRELKSSNSITKFDFDMDSITCFSNPLTEQSIKEHQQLLIATTNGLSFCMTLTGRLIRLIIQASLGWHSFIIQAGILLKQLVKECYSDKEYADYVIDPQG